MKTVLLASIPTAHTIHAIYKTQLTVKKNMGGGYDAYEEFETKKDAIKHLKKLAENLNESPAHYKEMMQEINSKSPYLRVENCVCITLYSKWEYDNCR